jgi:prevent-host-death family protein
MEIRSSSSLRNNYNAISAYAKKTQEPVFITVNGEGDGVFMSLEAYEKREELLKLRAQILLAEEQRIYEAKTISIQEAREELKNR